MKLGVVAALDFEARSLVAARLKAGQRVALPNGGALVCSGVGAARAAAAARSLAEDGARGLLSWGTAGGLAPELPAGSLVVPDTVLAADGGAFRADPALAGQLRERLPRDLPRVAGSLAEAPEPLASPEAKRRLAEASGAAAVDMESAALAAVAGEAGLLFIAVRVVLDDAATAVPERLLRALGPAAAGRPILRRIFDVGARPSLWPALLRLAWAYRRARATLAAAAPAVRSLLTGPTAH